MPPMPSMLSLDHEYLFFRVFIHQYLPQNKRGYFTEISWKHTQEGLLQVLMVSLQEESCLLGKVFQATILFKV